MTYSNTPIVNKAEKGVTGRFSPVLEVKSNYAVHVNVRNSENALFLTCFGVLLIFLPFGYASFFILFIPNQHVFCVYL